MKLDRRLEIIRKLVRFPISDGAKVTYLELLSHFWDNEDQFPSYTDLSAIRNVVRSAVQRHIEELETSTLLFSVRTPDNRKRYAPNYAALDTLDVVSREQLKGRIEKRGKPKKEKSKYTTSELVGYFTYLYRKEKGTAMPTDRVNNAIMKSLHQRFNSITLINAMNIFSKTYKRRKVSFRLSNFEKVIDSLVKSARS